MTGAELIKAILDNNLTDAEIAIRSDDSMDDEAVTQIFQEEDDSGDTVGVIAVS